LRNLRNAKFYDFKKDDEEVKLKLVENAFLSGSEEGVIISR
jgi:hypothetical protein